MWANEYSVETQAPPEQIWRLLADVAGWPAWDGDIERIEPIRPLLSAALSQRGATPARSPGESDRPMYG